MTRAFAIAFATVLATLTGTCVALAQSTGPSDQQPAPPLAPVVSGLAEADLVNFLRGLDGNLQTKPIKDGTVFHLTLRRDGWMYQLRVTSFAGSVWVDATLGEPLADVQKVPGQQLVQLLQSTFDIGPSHFCFAKLDNGKLQLYLCRYLERPNLTVDRLREQIDLFCGQVRNTYPAWNAVLTAVK